MLQRVKDMFNRIRCMLIKEFLQMFRDPRMRVVIFGAPVIQLTVLAFALTTDVTHIKTVVLDFDNTPSTRELVNSFTASGYFEVREYVHSQADMARLLDQGRVRAIIHIPAGFEEDLHAGRTAKVQILSDGTDSNTTSIVFGYANQIIGKYIEQRLLERLNALFASEIIQGRIDVETRAWFNPNLESKYYYVPGLIAVMLILVSMILTSIAIVREKEIGTIEQVMVTPISKLEFILGKTIPYIITGYITMTLMFFIAMLVFGVRISGSWVLLYLLTGIYLVGNLGLALLISVSASTQQQALLTAFFILMPSILLSGFMFPIHNMPQVVQYLTFLNPMRWYMEILRGVVMKGVGMDALWLPFIGQSVLAILFISLAIMRFKKTMA